ncbi:MAG: hypothetical protein ACRDD2_11840 [Sarcina sp.]
MFIDRAIKKQEKSYSRFIKFMIFLMILFPVLVFGFQIKNLYVYFYLTILEIAILIAIIVANEKMFLNYSCKNNFLRIKTSIFMKKIKLICDKIILVHSEKKGDEIEIIIVTTTRVGKRAFKLIGKTILRTHPALTMEYERIKKENPDTNYYYMVVKNGGFKKFILLDDMYKNCIKAKFTGDTIEHIKIARGQKEI